MSDLYQVLGVSPHAGADDIKRSYRRAVRECHPDINPSPAAEVRFKRVSVAYSVLSDPRQRALYDEFGEEALQPGFDPVLARRQTEARRHASNPYDTPFGDMSAFADVMSAAFEAEVDDDPPSADPGHGQEHTVRATVPAMLSFIGGLTMVSVARHGGRMDSVRVRVKPGARTGDVVHLPGLGPSNGWGGPPGDLAVVLEITEHPLLRRDGDDLELDVPITLLEAVQGGPIHVPTPTGPARVNLPANCAGAKLRLRGRGVQRPGRPGNLILHLRPVLPEDIDADVLDACRTIERAYRGDIRANLRL